MRQATTVETERTNSHLSATHDYIILIQCRKRFARFRLQGNPSDTSLESGILANPASLELRWTLSFDLILYNVDSSKHEPEFVPVSCTALLAFSVLSFAPKLCAQSLGVLGPTCYSKLDLVTQKTYET